MESSLTIMCLDMPVLRKSINYLFIYFYSSIEISAIEFHGMLSFLLAAIESNRMKFRLHLWNFINFSGFYFIEVYHVFLFVCFCY